jgi:hypothetical protein
MLAQLATVKTRLGITDTTDDTIITNFLEWASALADRFTNRQLERAASATYECQADKTEIILPRYPVESIATFKIKSNETDGYTTITGVTYVIKQYGIISILAPLGSAEQ